MLDLRCGNPNLSASMCRSSAVVVLTDEIWPQYMNFTTVCTALPRVCDYRGFFANESRSLRVTLPMNHGHYVLKKVKE